MTNLADLLNGRCHEYPEGSPTLSPVEVQERLALVPGWELVDDGKGIRFTEQEHHPDIQVRSYRTLQLDFSTHSIGGLTDNDFIMAARVNALRS